MHAQDREKALGTHTLSVFESKFHGHQADRINNIFYNPMGKYNVRYVLDSFIFYHTQELIFVEEGWHTGIRKGCLIRVCLLQRD